jgi:predicted metal-dependent hydrolase
MKHQNRSDRHVRAECGIKQRDCRASAPRRFADRAARSCAQTEKVCCQAPAMLLEDILNRLLQEKRTWRT